MPETTTWKYEGLLKEHQLIYGQSILARIQSKPNRNGKIIVTTLISVIYFGQKYQEKLQKRKNEWVAYRKKLSNRDMGETYINRKKIEVLRFIQSREKEA